MALNQKEQNQLANIMVELRLSLIADAKEQDSLVSTDTIDKYIDRACNRIGEHLVPVNRLANFLFVTRSLKTRLDRE